MPASQARTISKAAPPSWKSASRSSKGVKSGPVFGYPAGKDVNGVLGKGRGAMDTPQYLDLQHLATPQTLAPPVRDARAWTRASLGPQDWTVALPAEAHAELERAAKILRDNPLPTPLL